MRRKVDSQVNYPKLVQRYFAGLVILMILSLTFVSATLAYYYDSDFSSNIIGMSGKVEIEVVSKADAYVSIEDNTDTNLIIYIEDTYGVHIPGGWFEPTANIKVFQSTTHPLLRAIMDVQLINMETDEVITDEDIDKFDLAESLYDALAVIVTNNGWVYYPEDKYYYYRNTNEIKADIEDTVLWEVEVPEDDDFTVVHFIDDEIQFLEDIDSTYSGYGVKIIIRFEAIQNFIPNKDGYQLDNTIENSKLIFDNPDSNPYEDED